MGNMLSPMDVKLRFKSNGMQIRVKKILFSLPSARKIYILR